MGWVTLIADMHGRLPAVRPDSYLVLLAGDICPDGPRQREFMDGPLRDWLLGLPCPCVAAAGNHDHLIIEGGQPPDLPWHLIGRKGLVEIAGLAVYGTSLVLDGHGGWRASEEEIEAALADLPPRCDVLLTHQPPLGVKDRPSAARHPGSLALRHAIWKKEPRLAVFGHVHEKRGFKRAGRTYCVNATMGAGSGHPAVHGPWGLADESWRG